MSYERLLFGDDLKLFHKLTSPTSFHPVCTGRFLMCVSWVILGQKALRNQETKTISFRKPG